MGNYVGLDSFHAHLHNRVPGIAVKFTWINGAGSLGFTSMWEIGNGSYYLLGCYHYQLQSVYLSQ